MPANLGSAGRQLWREITAGYELRPDEHRILADAAREADLVDRLEHALRDASLLSTGSQGQPVASPLLSEVRQHRAILASLLRQLKLPNADDRVTRLRSAQARRAARARWDKGA